MTAPPTPSRPRQRLDAGQRRDQLVDATRHVLAEQGLRATTAEAIVQRAGVSKGLLWHYYADLEALLEDTASRTLAALAGAVGARIDLTAPAPEVIRAAIRAAADLVTTHRTERAALHELVVNLRTPDGAQRFRMDDYEPLYAAQEAIFRRGQRDGDFRPELDPRLLAVTYQGAVDAMLGHLEEHPELDPAHHAATVADILLGGICRPR